MRNQELKNRSAMDQFSEIRNEDKNQTFISNFSMINNL